MRSAASSATRTACARTRNRLSPRPSPRSSTAAAAGDFFGRQEVGQGAAQQQTKPTEARWRTDDYKRVLAGARESAEASPWENSVDGAEVAKSRFQRRDKCGDFDAGRGVQQYRQSLAEARKIRAKTNGEVGECSRDIICQDPTGEIAQAEAEYRARPPRSPRSPNSPHNRKPSITKKTNTWNAESYRVKIAGARRSDAKQNPFEGYQDKNGNVMQGLSFARNTRCGDFKVADGLEAYKTGRRAANKQKQKTDSGGEVKFLISPRAQAQ